jgi:plasmid stabilization system protein ParE
VTGRKRARLARLAAQELDDAAAQIDADRPGWGDKFYAEVFDALALIEEYPAGWQIIDDGSGERRFVVDRFPCVLVFVEADTEIVITAVVYGGREPGYWRRR